MKATETKLLEFLKKPVQFIIPIYQRTYRWSAKQCEQLWRDIERAGRNESVHGHFVGSIVYVEKGLYSVSSLPQLLVIDGQQRLTTISLILVALSEALEGTEGVDGLTAKKLKNYYLLNSEEEGELRYKLQLTQTDRTTLERIVGGKPLPANASFRVKENLEYFRSRMPKDLDGLSIINKGLAKLIVVDISLNRDHDNPQLIFESLNSTGLDLSQADLIRNYVLMGLEPNHQKALYEGHWRPMEQSFGQEAYARLFDRFMRDYLTVKTGTIPNIAAVYEEYKRYAATAAAGRVDEIVADVHRMSEHFVALALERAKEKPVRVAVADINALKVDVAYPFLLELYDDYVSEKVSLQDLVRILRFVESYVFRRAVCGIPTNSLNKTFPNLGKEVDKNNYLESLQAEFLKMSGYRRFPDDEEFRRELMVKDLYNFRSRNYWLRRIETHDHKEVVNVEELTIEHILPQNTNLSAAWRAELGEDWKDVQQRFLHTLGNLTLTGYNSEMSDRSFADKQSMPGGFKESPLRLNSGLGMLERWDENAIRNRSEKLATLACKVWPAPKLDATVLAKYKPAPKASKYSLADHPNLKGKMLDLFETLSKQVLNLDASVTQDFLKHYVAFKAPGNFLNVVPKSHVLDLYLSLDIDDARDPGRLCIDVAGVNKWATGNVKVVLSTSTLLPKVMDLVRQALDTQIGNGED